MINDKEIIRYFIVGILTTIVSISSYFICIYLFFAQGGLIGVQVANALSWFFSVTFAYFTNRKYVFRSRSPNISKEIILFFGSRISTLFVESIALGIFISVFLLNSLLSKIISQIIVFISNYLLSKLLVFK